MLRIAEAALGSLLIGEVADGDEGVPIVWVDEDLAGEQACIAGSAKGPVLMQGDNGVILAWTGAAGGQRDVHRGGNARASRLSLYSRT